MTSDTAIPQCTGDVRTPTRIYFDRNAAFGAQHARPATTEGDGRTWDDDELLDAAHRGAAGQDLHPRLLAVLCRRFADMAQNEATHADVVRALTRQLATTEGVSTALQAELVGERAERNRIARLHAELSEQLVFVTRQRDQAAYERTLALHRAAGTTPGGIRAALEQATRSEAASAATQRSVQLDDRFHDSDLEHDTQVVQLEDMHPAGGGR